MESTNIPADVKEEGNKDEVSYQLDLIRITKYLFSYKCIFLLSISQKLVMKLFGQINFCSVLVSMRVLLHHGI